MRSREFVVRASTYAWVIALLLFIPAVVSLFLAIWSAVASGQVMVISLGRYETARESVPWLQGWARFASPFILAIAAAAYPTTPSASTLRFLAFSLLAFIGISALCYSLWFTSPDGTLGFLLISACIALAYYVDAIFGRRWATILVVSIVALLVYGYAVA